MTKIEKSKYDLIIAGGGIGAITAARYAAESLIKFALIAPAIGGQADTTSLVTNWPLLGPISGIELKELMIKEVDMIKKVYGDYMSHIQARVILTKERSDGEYDVIIEQGGAKYTLITKALIIATGADYRNLPVPGAERLRGKGVYFCGICDGPAASGQEAWIVGDRDTAMVVAQQVAKHARKVVISFLGEELMAKKSLLDKVIGLPNVELLPLSTVIEIKGGGKVEGLVYKDIKTGELIERAVAAVFPSIGLVPASDAFKHLGITNQHGQINLVDMYGRTSAPLVFAVGAVTEKLNSQLISSAGQAAEAAIGAVKDLDGLINVNPCKDCSENMEALLEDLKENKESVSTDIDDKQFFELVLARAGYTILEWRIEGCPDCLLAKEFFEAARLANPDISWHTIVWENEEAKQWFEKNGGGEIKNVPTFILMQSGKEAARRVNMKEPEAMINELLEIVRNKK